MKYAKVKELLKEYSSGGLNSVKSYLTQDDILIEEFSWCEKIKMLLYKKLDKSVKEELDLVIYKFKKD